MKVLVMGSLVCMAFNLAARAEPVREVTASAVSIAAIQEAVNALGGAGRVRIPAGEGEAIGTLTIPGGIDLVGAGVGRTRLFRAGKTPAKSSEPVIRIDGKNGLPTQVSGLELRGFQDPKNTAWDTGLVLIGVRDFRVHHCRFERFGMAAVSARGVSRGVVDHCEFTDNYKRSIANVGYGVVVYGPGRWRETFEPGSADAVFIEDCVFRGQRHAVASNNGAHYVFRHNHIIGNDNSQAVDAHGPGYGSKCGTQWVEVYDNVIEKPLAGVSAMMLRGGGGVVFRNTIRNYFTGIVLTLDFDGRLDWTRPYPIPEQVRDMWVWDNSLNGKKTPPGVPPRSAGHIQAGRDFFTKAKPGYTPYAYPHPLTRPE
ncbi:MAG: right-handed parallel beta-helix repeat-containing protein [Lentisphaeria bacterium]|nr:right-handed parallel beta-helix repeat-containing protein [Lentisphaeria bacterium]